MSKNFSNFLKEKEHKLENINEDFTKFIRNMFGSVNLQEEEQNFIFKVNQAFRRYANKLIGKQYQSKILGKLLPIDKARAESIYRNLKNNFKIILSKSYKGKGDKQKGEATIDENIIKLEKLIQTEEELVAEKDAKEKSKRAEEEAKENAAKKQAAEEHAKEVEERRKNISLGAERFNVAPNRINGLDAEKFNVTPDQIQGLGVVSSIAAPASDKEFGSPSSVTKPPPDEEVATSNTAPSTPPEPSIPILGGITNFKFMQNLNKLILSIEQYFKDSSEENVPDKSIFNALKLIKRLYKNVETESEPKKRFKQHGKNISHLGKDNWKILLTKIIETFMSKQCDFADDTFTNNAIEYFIEKAPKYNPVQQHYEAFHTYIRLHNKNWQNILSSLSVINKFVDEFCRNNPDLCGKTGRGSSKLLSKLRENKNITFSEWLLITENKLF
jgi:hypothetical protein